MAKLTRKHQKIFCDVAPTNKLGVFGSLAAGSPAYSDDPDTIQSLAAYGAGLGSALINNAPPAIQDIDGLCNLFTRQIGYLLQTGIPEYDVNTTYYIGSIVNYGNDLYVSVADDNINNAFYLTTKWMLFKSKKVTRYTGWGVTPAYNDYIVEMDGTTAGFDPPYYFTLPTPTATNKGRVIILKHLCAGGDITVGSSGGVTIDDSENISVTPIYSKKMFISNGTNWEVII
jgi:hypothetical protein